MMFSIQQGHCVLDTTALNLKNDDDTAQCAAVSASDLSIRGHQWYKTGI